MNTADFIANGAVPYVTTLQDMSTYFLSAIWNYLSDTIR